MRGFSAAGSRAPIAYHPVMNRLLRFAASTALLALCGPVFGQATTTLPPPALHAVLALDPAARIHATRAGPVPGLYEVSTGRRLLEVSADGRYVFEGHLFDLRRGVDLATRETSHWRARLLKRMPPASFITFSPAHPRFLVTVFTDPSCAYCQIMAGQLPRYLARGIALRFAADPAELGVRAGNPLLARIWCAADPHAAFVAAFTRKSAPPATHDCHAALSASEAVATRLQLPGTPAVIGPDGALLGGYESPSHLLDKLELDAASRR